jgi:hypothetical protein
MACWSLVLLASNYMIFAGLYVCLAADYLVWGRRQRRLALADWLWLLLPQAVLGAPIVLFWNTLGTEYAGTLSTISMARRALFVWWSFRDLNACEFGIAWLLVFAPLLGFLCRRPWLVRLPLAILLYTLVINRLSPVNSTVIAEVRYLVATIPLWMIMAVLVIEELTRRRAWLALALGMLAFGTNLLHGTWLFPGNPIPVHPRCTVLSFIRELVSPPVDPYSVAARWINEHVASGQSIWVLPDYMVYPLIYHAPGPIYAWQLPAPPAGQFKDLPPIQFRGLVAPDYILAFGPSAGLARETIQAWNQPGLDYSLVATLDCYWQDVHRPELFLRSFEPIREFDRRTEAIYVFRRSSANGSPEPGLTTPEKPSSSAGTARRSESRTNGRMRLRMSEHLTPESA